MFYGAIEAGGTKFVCAVSDENLTIQDRISIPTTTPEETLTEVFAFFDQYDLYSIGVGSFGPIDINQASETFGYITSTPKKGWNNFNFVGALKERYLVPIAFTTDVNAAAFGEYYQGSAKANHSCIYLTIGTGVGGGFVLNGQIIDGFGHPEMGHVLLKPHPEDAYHGHCPYHGNCLEGLACGPAIEDRMGQKAETLGETLGYWEIEAYYLAQALVNYTLVLRPEKIILGGGVMKQAQLFQLIREQFAALLNNYVEVPHLDEYIVSPGLIDNAGVTGCLLLAKEAK
ncbi:ROK family protein [Aquibacillus salsiterrae]|uniref:fructokinase n=1 Tax=Aquibacillus salsiterrae TaxID=2950439 RepID=A0A9X3WF16_9BACI|nr:ROK family protein [Aquibacillus salsiterrae]MDC3418622.1 ROK family protein [Aquibacillus salsiterrae]